MENKEPDRLIPSVLEILSRPFSDTDIKTDKPRADGFAPRSIDWPKIVTRLDEAFEGGWSWQVVQVHWMPNFVAVHGRLSYGSIFRDGIGSAPCSGQDPEYDVKAAASDALKRAAILMGIGIQLYENRSYPATGVSPVMGSSPAQPFQIDEIVTMFERQFGYTREVWMAQVQITDLGQITASLAHQILSGSHPFVKFVRERLNTPRTGLVSSNA